MIRLLTIMTAGDGYLNFLGNEWGHPEWIDFPREGNGWSYDHARRLWHLADDTNLRYRYLNAFDRDMIRLVKKEGIFRFRPEPTVRDNERQVLVFSRGGLLLAFNFNPSQSFRTIASGQLPENMWRFWIRIARFMMGLGVTASWCLILPCMMKWPAATS